MDVSFEPGIIVNFIATSKTKFDIGPWKIDLTGHLDLALLGLRSPPIGRQISRRPSVAAPSVRKPSLGEKVIVVKDNSNEIDIFSDWGQYDREKLSDNTKDDDVVV